eukprot:s562_g30.t3
MRRGKAAGALKEASPVASQPSPTSPTSPSNKVDQASAPTESPHASASPVASQGDAPTDTPEAPQAPQEIPAGCYSLEQLTDKRTWEKLDVVSTERETYLPDGVFQQLFGMPKADFAKLPKLEKGLRGSRFRGTGEPQKKARPFLNSEVCERDLVNLVIVQSAPSLPVTDRVHRPNLHRLPQSGEKTPRTNVYYPNPEGAKPWSFVGELNLGLVSQVMPPAEAVAPPPPPSKSFQAQEAPKSFADYDQNSELSLVPPRALPKDVVIDCPQDTMTGAVMSGMLLGSLCMVGCLTGAAWYLSRRAHGELPAFCPDFLQHPLENYKSEVRS